MELYAQGSLKLVAQKSFINRETKEKVDYNVHYFQVIDSEGDQQVLEINSTKDFSSDIGKTGTILIGLRSEGKLYKLSLKDFKV